MKKQILGTVILVAVFVLAACNKYEPKSVKLETLNDSVNYTLGLTNGDNIKSYLMQKDSSDKAVQAFVSALDKAYKTKADNDELYKLGLQIGNSLKMMKEKGLFGDSTITFNEEVLLQGLVNSLNSYKEGMNSTAAQEYLQQTMMRIQSSRAPQQPEVGPEVAPAN